MSFARFDRACGAADLRPWRASATRGLAGTVVDIGFGSGAQPARSPRWGRVGLRRRAGTVVRRLAAARIAASTARIEHIGLDREAIPLDDASCDAALSTFTLCTIPDVAQALAEVRRVLRPGARLDFLEHGLSPDPTIAAWQRRIEPLQKRLADGCHLTRDPAARVRAAGFEIERVESRYARGPKPWSWFSESVAVRR